MAPFGKIYMADALNLPYPPGAMSLTAAKLGGVDLQIASDYKHKVDNKKPEFLAKFPNGKMPGLETSDDTYVFESQAILYYIADVGTKREQLLGADAKTRAHIQQWVFFAIEELKAISRDYLQMQYGRIAYNAEQAETWQNNLTRALNVLDGHLKGKKYLVAEQLTIADLTLGSILTWTYRYMFDGEARGQFPEVTRWFVSLWEIPEFNESFGPIKLLETKPSFPPVKQA